MLVLGGGLAGHRAAVGGAQFGRLRDAGYHARGASPHIIGFNVPLGDVDRRDNPDVYFEDMVRGGYALNERRLVRALADGAKPAFAELVAIGVPFARNGSRFAQRHLSGNTYARSVYHPNGSAGSRLNASLAIADEIGVQAYPGWRAIALCATMPMWSARCW